MLSGNFFGGLYKKSVLSVHAQMTLKFLACLYEKNILVYYGFAGFFEKQLLILKIASKAHRVDRVLGFFSSRPNWDSPTPSPAGECVPLTLGSVGGGGYALVCGRGLGESQFRRGDRHCCTLGI